MAMNDRIYILRETITKITQMIAGKNIQVTQRGVSAYVKADEKGRPFLVNLPYIPDNATDELIYAIQGFLDHEVAHILFTDFAGSTKVMRSQAGSMFNILEDTRIERAMGERFRGSKDNLECTGKFFLEKYTMPKLNEAIAAGDQDTANAILAVPLIRAMSGQSVFKDFMKDKMPMVEEMYNEIKDLQPKIEALASTKDSIEIAQEIQKRLKKLSGPGDDPGDEEEGGAKKRGGGGKKGGKKGAGDDEGEEAGGGGDGDDEGDDGTPGDGDDDYQESKRDPTAPIPKESDISKSAGCSWDKIDKEIANGYDDAVSTVITNSAIDAAVSADYLVYSTDKDVVEPLHVGRDYKDHMLQSLQEKVDHMVGPLQKDLERAISARSLESWSPGHRTGRLNAAALSRLRVGDTRVFRRRIEVNSKDVAVELVVDMSGSMSGSKIHTASQAAYALASVLERIGIPCEVICFTTGEAVADHTTLRNEEVKLGRKYSRMESLYMPILKGFGERMTPEIKKRFGWLPNSGDLRNNVDGECVEIAARRLLGRREKGKIMMVLSDGAPHAAGMTTTLGPHLKQVVEKVAKSGVKVIGIGIESEDVRRFYPKSLVLNDVDELPVVVMKELRQLVVQ